MEEREYDVALSFAGEDRSYVEKVAQILRENEIAVFYDNFNKVDLWGKNLVDHLSKVYAEDSRFIVMFISKHYAEKIWTNHERKFAQDRAFKMQEDCILPVRFDDTDIPGLPSTTGYLDLRSTTEEELAELIALKVSSAKAPNNEDEEFVEFGNEENQNEPEVLHSETNSLEPDTHIAYTCNLEEEDTIEYEIESEQEIEVMLMDKRDYKTWTKNGEPEAYYEHFENCLILKEFFTAPEAGKYRVIAVNSSAEKIKIKVNINLMPN